jgi:hypothetical protein
VRIIGHPRVAAADELEEEIGAAAIDRQVANLVNDQAPGRQ